MEWLAQQSNLKEVETMVSHVYKAFRKGSQYSSWG